MHIASIETRSLMNFRPQQRTDPASCVIEADQCDQYAGPRAIIVGTGVGQHQMWAAQH
jgi:thiamine pyrophosphate-dependent acetolactate synthase large subunit-like protein